MEKKKLKKNGNNIKNNSLNHEVYINMGSL